MNDCVWCWVDVCECNSCECEQHIDANTLEGGRILDKWSDAVEIELSKIKYDFAKENGYKKVGNDIKTEYIGCNWHKRSGIYKPKIIIPSVGGFRALD
jgi:hypothetical protein